MTPEIQEAMIAYIRDGYFSYTPKMGCPAFVQGMARVLKERKDEDIDPSMVLPIDSAARGMYVIADVVLQPGMRGSSLIP